MVDLLSFCRVEVLLGKLVIMATNDFWNSEVVCNLCLFPYT